MGRPLKSSNIYTDIVGAGVTLIETKNGACLIIDTSDRAKAEQHSWTVHKHRYAYAGVGRGKEQKKVYLHRLLCETTDEKPYVDHINAVREDCRSANLRACSTFQNSCNQSLRSNNSTGYKGVSRDRKSGKFLARVSDGKKYTHLGTFATPELAAQAAIVFREKNHGEYARHE